MLMSVISVVMVSLLSVSPAVQAQAPRLVSAAWLAEHLNDADLVLLHVGTARDYPTRIPGARLIKLAGGSFTQLRAPETGLGIAFRPLALKKKNTTTHILYSERQTM